MHVKAIIHNLLQDSAHRDGGYDIKTVAFETLPWSDFEQCRVHLADGSVFVALFEEGEKISPFVELPKEGK